MSADSIYFSEAHEKFRQFLRELFAQEILPYIDTWEKATQIPRSLWLKLAEHGLFELLDYKQDQEKDFFYSVIFLEELGRLGSVGVRVAIAVHMYMANSYLMLAGSNELKVKYLYPAMTGTKIAALGITEEQAGSDLKQIQTTVMVDANSPDFLIIQGQKKFVANGTTADFIVLAAKTVYSDSSSVITPSASGLSLIVVDMQSAGINKRKLNMLGWHAADVAEIDFDRVKVPASNVIGGLNRGFYYIMRCMQLERLSAGILAIGGIENCLIQTWQYLSKRKVFDGTLSQFQSIRHKMANYSTELAAIKQLAYHTAWLYEQKKLPIAECSMVKLKATELARKTAQDCLQFCGAFGYQADQSLSRIYRDTQGATIAGGASEVMLDIIAQSVFEESSFLSKH